MDTRASATRVPEKASWLSALVAILLVQTTCAYLTRIVPTLAPVVTARYGLDEAAIGYLSGLGVVGSIVFLAAGAPFIRRFGPLRTLQGGLGLGLVGLAAMLAPAAAALALGSFLVGVGYAPSAPAGNEVLHRFAPPRHRTLIFSIKQAGVPVGGVLAGLALPPIAEAYGWGGVVLASLALVVAVALAVQPMRAGTDALRDPTVAVTPARILQPDNLVRPLALLAAHGALARLAAVGFCLSIGQGIWMTFLVAFGVARLGLDLTAAGLLFAVVQATGIVGRVLLGWAADRTGSGRRTLQVTLATSAATTLALALAAPAWPYSALVALAAVAGVTVSSWNGVQMAEVAALCPPGQVAEASAGATIVIFAGYTLAPVLFALLLASGGRWDVGFAAVAAATLLGLLALDRSPRAADA